MRGFQTSIARRDIDQAAKYIGAGAATVGVAGSGIDNCYCKNFIMKINMTLCAIEFLVIKYRDSFGIFLKKYVVKI